MSSSNLENSSASKGEVRQTRVQLKDIGRKARARLEEEKSKRPEIKRLDSLPNEERVTKLNDGTSFGATTSSFVRPKKKRSLRQPSSYQHHQQRQRQKTGEWTPDVSHIQVPSKEFRSTIVKLHGLPIECTVEHIKKFFSGLHPERVLILLSNQIAVPELDAASRPKDRGEEDFLRVFVKFDSAPTAVLASERSGETISFHADGDLSERKTFSIGVTQVRKDIAVSISTLAVTGVPGVPLSKTLSNVESKLHPRVREILWSAAAKEVGLVVDEGILRSKVFVEIDNPKTLAGYQEIATHHDRLIEIHDELLCQLPYPSVEESGSVLQKDPIVRLTNEASKKLVAEMERLESLLYQTRVSRGFGQIGFI